jgi:hypothetical protein
MDINRLSRLTRDEPTSANILTAPRVAIAAIALAVGGCAVTQLPEDGGSYTGDVVSCVTEQYRQDNPDSDGSTSPTRVELGSYVTGCDVDGLLLFDGVNDVVDAALARLTDS